LVPLTTSNIPLKYVNKHGLSTLVDLVFWRNNKWHRGCSQILCRTNTLFAGEVRFTVLATLQPFFQRITGGGKCKSGHAAEENWEAGLRATAAGEVEDWGANLNDQGGEGAGGLLWASGCGFKGGHMVHQGLWRQLAGGEERGGGRGVYDECFVDQQPNTCKSEGNNYVEDVRERLQLLLNANSSTWVSFS
jgi:hypothetical protein